MLANTKVTTAGLAAFEGLSRLTSLDVSGTKIDDASLARLDDGEITGLRVLWLRDTPITDAGLVHLAGFSGMTSPGPHQHPGDRRRRRPAETGDAEASGPPPDASPAGSSMTPASLDRRPIHGSCCCVQSLRVDNKVGFNICVMKSVDGMVQ